ncbi:MAG: hypothetical protein JXO51_08695, partial [Candidatus Aminicenantes bacterium]|nr:hypothetical protein [Candidatus Aminicenantes bacterium]
MDRPEAARAENAAATTMNDLFSVDADAHLSKLAEAMFPTSAQLPVELVRSALKREARSVHVEIRRRRLTVLDDGSGIAAAQWQALARAFDSGCDVVEREKAIAVLQGSARPGIGLLAAFVPGASAIRIANGGSAPLQVMLVSGSRVRLGERSPREIGTRVEITRRGGEVALEKRLIRELCAAVGAEIVLNGRPIEKHPPLKRSLGRLGVDLGPEHPPALVAVPLQGDICRVWLLDQGIPWQVVTRPAFRGLVFEVAMESAAPPAEPLFEALAGAAGRLYQWLAENHHSFPEKFQERIEDLLFRKTRWAGDLQLLSAFAPFRLWRSRRRLNL